MISEVKTDALIIPFTDQEELVIASDNSGSVGMKPLDNINTSYDVVGYFSFRVAYMDCVAAGGNPVAVSIMNFNGDEAWDSLLEGIDQATEELGIEKLPVTGSTETNFSLEQSATSITIIGRKNVQQHKRSINEKDYRIAVIGKPLVGNEVFEFEEKVAPLHLFDWFSKQKEVHTILPVGSKGIAYELTKVWPNHDISFAADLDVTKTAGPATCFIVIYDEKIHQKVVDMAGNWFHIQMDISE